MVTPSAEETRPRSSRPGWRLVMLTGMFLILFFLLFTRLWFIQVAAGKTYQTQASRQTVYQVSTQAPRGEIRDREGRLLATSRFVPAILVDRKQLPTDLVEDVQQQLSTMLDIPPGEIADAFETGGPRITIAEVDAETAYRVMERRRQLPGVVVELVPARVYPEGDVLAHVLGHIGRPSEEDVAERPEIDPNVIIGKAGVERTYDEFLQGDPGTVSYRINARNQVIRELREIPPTQGDTIYLTIDLEVQRELEEVLEGVIELSNEVKATDEDEIFLHTTERAAGMVLDPKTGEVIAMASYPDFDPSVFVGGLSQTEFESLNESQAFNNLVIQGEYAPASTFKAVGYVTALEEQMWPEDITVPGPEGTVECDGRIEFPFGDGSQEVLYDWYHPEDYGSLDLHTSLARSCNIYFWKVALRIWRDYQGTERENLLQNWARQMGFGSTSGIDLPFEHDGLVPDRALFEDLAAEGVIRNTGWQGGDLMNMAVGQGFMLSTPLQLANAYASIVNGGVVWKPHVVQSVRDASGTEVLSNDAEVVRRLDIDPATISMFRQDLTLIPSIGTAQGAFADFGPGLEQVGGKTGTTKGTDTRDPTALFVGVAPVDDPRYVVVVVVEEGGNGGRVAAPGVRRILQSLMGNTPTELVPGEESD